MSSGRGSPGEEYFWAAAIAVSVLYAAEILNILYETYWR